MTNNILNQPVNLPCGVNIKNTIFKSAMSESMGDKYHNPTPLLNQLYERWALGGAGIAVSGNVMIDRNALGEPANVVLDEKSDLNAFKAWAKSGTQQHCALWIQLNHPGRQSPRMLSKTPVAPSAVPLEGSLKRMFKPPRALDKTEIKTLVQRFATSAKLAKKAGFSGVQIHAAHGYLISQFLSPKANIRDDEYGGSIENRMRFLMETYHAIRSVVGADFPIGVKMNSKDFTDGGFSEEDSIKVIEQLSQAGIDLIEISGGNYEKPVMSTGEQDENDVFFLEFAKRITTQTPIVLTGGFRSLKTMERVLENNYASMIGLGRPLVIEPDLPYQLLGGRREPFHLSRLKTGFKSIDKRFGPIIGNTHYEQQMRRIAKGKKTKTKRNGFAPLIHTFFTHGPKSLMKRRVK